jgi:serine/threonine protein kinase/response regulator RpfG family c-di-GMP phosphodiesterase
MSIPETIGKYEIERLLGRGGMSIVYQARDPAIQRSVALKVVEKAKLDAEEARRILDRFKYEAQAAGRLVHPRIVTIFDYGEDDAYAYIAMELVRGESVHEYLLHHQGEPDLRVIGDIIISLLDALEHSHLQGVIHRDIKPSNILINEDGIKVSDFGIARIESSALTQYGLVVGTPFYMSPEQCMGEDTDARTDLYSVGVIAYELLTGQRPFKGKGNNASIMREVIDVTPRDPSELNPRLTGQMDWVVQKALAKTPEDRYQSAAEMREDFRGAIEDCLLEAGQATAAAGTPHSPGSYPQPETTLPDPIRPTPAPRPAPAMPPPLSPEAEPAAPVAVVPDDAAPDEPPATAPPDTVVRVPPPPSPTVIRVTPNLKAAAKKIRFAAPSGHAATPPAPERAPEPAQPLALAPIAEPPEPESGTTRAAPARVAMPNLPPAAAPAPTPPEQPKQKHRVLFVDDEERILSALKSIFRNKYHVFTATNGEQAVDFLKRFRIQLVVSDQRMPGMLGVEVLRQAKEVSPATVRILLTGYSDLASIVGSINDGEVYRFINKPWNNQDIQQVVADAVAIGAELTDTTLPQSAPVEQMEEALLLVDAGREQLRVLQELFSGTCRIIHAQTMQDALEAMATETVAVIVADIGQALDGDTAAFKLLKQEHPEILTIILTDASDSELVIELINQAQVFRFLNKPVNVKLLRNHVHAALSKYQSLKAAPAYLKQNRPSISAALRNSKLGQALLERIKSLKFRFGRS